MSQNDLIADGLTQIRNAVRAEKDRVTLPCSRTLSEILRILKEEGYIVNFRMIQEKTSITQIRVQLKLADKRKYAIQSLTRISKGSCRVYKGYRDLRQVLRGLGISIMSTPKGIMTDKKARQLKVGGEVLCEVY